MNLLIVEDDENQKSRDQENVRFNDLVGALSDFPW